MKTTIIPLFVTLTVVTGLALAACQTALPGRETSPTASPAILSGPTAPPVSVVEAPTMRPRLTPSLTPTLSAVQRILHEGEMLPGFTTPHCDFQYDPSLDWPRMPFEGRYQGWQIYTNHAYAFQLLFPPDWTLAECQGQDPNFIQIKPGAFEDTSIALTVGFRRPDQNLWLSPPGGVAGSERLKGSLDLDYQKVNIIAIVDQDQTKAVYYLPGTSDQRTETPIQNPLEINSSGQQFTFSLRVENPDDGSSQIPREVQYAADRIVLSLMETSYWKSEQPDGGWSAYSSLSWSYGSDLMHTGLVVERKDGAQQYLLINRWEEPRLGYGYPRPISWSRDGDFLYYTSFNPVPDGCQFFFNGSDLWRVNLADGTAEQLAQVPSMNIALSPDERSLAYIDYGWGPAGGESSGVKLVVQEWASGRERSIPIGVPGEYSIAGAMAWSPDGRALVLAASAEPCLAPFQLVRVDLDRPAARVLVADTYYFPLEWTAAGVRLSSPTQEQAWLDPLNGEVSP